MKIETSQPLEMSVDVHRHLLYAALDINRMYIVDRLWDFKVKIYYIQMAVYSYITN